MKEMAREYLNKKSQLRVASLLKLNSFNNDTQPKRQRDASNDVFHELTQKIGIRNSDRRAIIVKEKTLEQIDKFLLGITRDGVVLDEPKLSMPARSIFDFEKGLAALQDRDRY